MALIIFLKTKGSKPEIIILGRPWCEGHGFSRISIMSHLTSSHFQEEIPQKFNIQPHRVDGEVN